MEVETDSDQSESQEYRAQRENSKRLRQVFEAHFKRIFCSNGFVKHMNQRCTGSNDSTSYILLCAAIQRNDTRSAAQLIKHYCKGNMGKADPSKDIPLQLAVLAGNLDIVEMLLHKGARASVSFQDQREPLHLICDRQCSPVPNEATRLRIARLLLEHGADPNALERLKRDSPLILAVRSKCVELVKLLLDVQGLDKYHLNKHQENALHVAFSENAGIDTIELIYDSGFQLDHLDQERLSALSYAVRNLMNSGFGSLFSFNEPLKPVRFLLDRGVSVDSCLDKRANRILHMICQNHAAQTMKLFLDRGAEVNARNEDGKTPLHFCAENQSPALVRLLLDHGADVEALTDKRQSVLHFAAANKNPRVLELLLVLLLRQRALDVDAKANDDNFTPLFNAVWSNRRENVRLLLDWRANVNERIINNQVVLHVAVDQKHVDIVELLLRHDADLNALDDYGNSPLTISLYQIADSVNSDWSDATDDADEDVLRPAEAVQKILSRHAALLHSSRQLSEHSLRVVNNPHFKDYFDDCLVEIERLKDTKLDDNLDLAKILVSKQRELVSYVRNERFERLFNEIECVKAFPIYGKSLEREVRVAMERLAMLNVCTTSLDQIVQSLGESWIDTCLPCLVAEHILDYLNGSDLQNLAMLAFGD